MCRFNWNWATLSPKLQEKEDKNDVNASGGIWEGSGRITSFTKLGQLSESLLLQKPFLLPAELEYKKSRQGANDLAGIEWLSPRKRGDSSFQCPLNRMGPSFPGIPDTLIVIKAGYVGLEKYQSLVNLSSKNFMVESPQDQQCSWNA